MPENPEKKLGGYAGETRSSNAAIERTLRGLVREISGAVGEPIEAIVAQTLPPVNIGKISGNHNSVELTKLTKFPSEKLTHKDSAFANNIQIERKLKKAA